MRKTWPKSNARLLDPGAKGETLLSLTSSRDRTVFLEAEGDSSALQEGDFDQLDPVEAMLALLSNVNKMTIAPTGILELAE
jgi:hypothetical protein